MWLALKERLERMWQREAGPTTASAETRELDDAQHVELEAHGEWLEQNPENPHGNSVKKRHVVFANRQLANLSLRRTRLERADLSGADLSGADLSGADLSGADLSGADLSGADLSSADLARAEFGDAQLELANLQDSDLRGAHLGAAKGLRPIQLAGSSMPGAVLPKSVQRFDGLEKIDELAKICRGIFLALTAACVYSWLTVAAATDASLVLDNVRHELPIINTPVPMSWFFVLAPLALLFVYFYFQLVLQKLWDELAEMPAVLPDGRSVIRRSHPWLPVSYARVWLPRFEAQHATFAGSRNLVSRVGLWGLTPLTLGAFWARYLIAHDWVGTFAQALLFVLAVFLSFLFHGIAIETLKGRFRKHPQQHVSVKRRPGLVGRPRHQRTGALTFSLYGEWNPVLRTAVGLCVCVCVLVGTASFMVFTKEQDWSQRWHESAADWLPYHKELGGVLRTSADLKELFAENGDFVGLDLDGADLQRATLSQAKLTTTSLRSANLTRAVLDNADLQRANLDRAVLNRTFLHGANLARATFAGAHLIHARLEAVQAFGAVFRGADLTRARMLGANLVSADLRCARLVGADLRGADLTGADLRGANLKGAELAGADDRTAIRGDTECDTDVNRRDEQSSRASAQQTVHPGQKVIVEVCYVCHLTPGINVKAPNLANVFGRPSGEEDYAYSKLLGQGAVTWNRRELEDYLADPSTFIPESKMAFPGFGEEEKADRDALLDYMEDSLKYDAPL